MMTTKQSKAKAGSTRAKDEDNGKMTPEQAGTSGGSVVLEKYGTDYFAEIGARGGLARGAINYCFEISKAFHEGHHRMFGIPAMPDTYRSYFERSMRNTEGLRQACGKYMKHAWQLLEDAGFDTEKNRPFARSILEADAKNMGWGERTVMLYMPKELKDEDRALLGQKGGQATSRNRQARGGGGTSTRKSSGQTTGVAKGEPEPVNEPRSFSVTVKCTPELPKQLMDAAGDALKASSITFHFSGDVLVKTTHAKAAIVE